MQSYGSSGSIVNPIPDLRFSSIEQGSGLTSLLAAAPPGTRIVLYSACLTLSLSVGTSNSFSGNRKAYIQDTTGTRYLEAGFPVLGPGGGDVGGYYAIAVPMIFNGAAVPLSTPLQLVTDAGQTGEAMFATAVISYVIK